MHGSSDGEEHACILASGTSAVVFFLFMERIGRNCKDDAVVVPASGSCACRPEDVARRRRHSCDPAGSDRVAPSLPYLLSLTAFVSGKAPPLGRAAS
jgi:hypothetical protein